MAEKALSLEEFVQVIRPTVEHEIDEMILAQTPGDRAFLMRHRELMVSKTLDHILIANQRRRIQELEERLRPQLVEPGP